MHYNAVYSEWHYHAISGLVWKYKMPHEVKDQVNGLFFVGDSTISYGIGTDSAAHSALLCYPKVLSFLSSK